MSMHGQANDFLSRLVKGIEDEGKGQSFLQGFGGRTRVTVYLK